METGETRAIPQPGSDVGLSPGKTYELSLTNSGGVWGQFVGVVSRLPTGEPEVLAFHTQFRKNDTLVKWATVSSYREIEGWDLT